MEDKQMAKTWNTNEIREKLFNDILDYMGETREEAIHEIKRYMKAFPNETDYNIYQYGNMAIYNDQVWKHMHKLGLENKLMTLSKENPNEYGTELANMYKRGIRQAISYAQAYNLL